MTIQQYLHATIQKIGEEVAENGEEASFHSQILQGLEERRSSIQGVSLDEELVDLQRYHRSYQAAARLFQSVDELFETLLNMGG